MDRWDPGFSRFLLQPGPRLLPSGDFDLTGADGDLEVVCGLDAREVLSFPAGTSAILRFLPGGAAQYPPPTKGGYTTAWVDARGVEIGRAHV